jgi:2-deoxy-D-gluconate 3-dehydrogenase
MSPDPFDLEGRVALVTGANTGLGQGIAVALAQAGAHIAAIGRSAPDATADAVRAAGRECLWIKGALDPGAPLAAMVQQATSRFGAVDILVNNAGTIRRADALDFSEEDWDAVMGVNLKTAFFLSQAVARQAVAAERAAKIINLVSMLSFQGGIRVASYTASKSGLLGITRLLANEWAGKGINVNAIAPGYFETNNTEALRADAQRNRDILARIPAGRWGVPADLGGAAVFLASRASDYVHGAVIPVDGGWLAR